ncbi:metallophosphoesterase [Sulfurimonas sp.]|uniref:metallophosphoesterase n=1 Tax=Sulfurimonas sp. TaxID=2022749 RepID=UPI00260A16A8|nr:metallophosphoesterase [Sulfurimonas sp.]
MIKYSLVLATLLMFSGCGSSTSNQATSDPIVNDPVTNDPVTNDSVTSISGVAVDDYIVGATVKLYATDGVELKLEEECKTENFGYFNCLVSDTIASDENILVVVQDDGKLDVDGNMLTINDTKDFNGKLAAVVTLNDSFIVSPLTSNLVAQATGTNLVIDGNISYIASDINISAFGKYSKDILEAQHNNLNIKQITETDRKLVQEQAQEAFKYFEDLREKEEFSSTIANVNMTLGDYGQIFFAHMADIHLTADDEVASVFGGTITPVSTMKEAVANIISYNPDVVIQTGDLVALADSNSLDQDEKWFTLAKENIIDPIRNEGIPFLFSPGNHDQAGIKVKDVNKTDDRYANGLIFQYVDNNQTKTYYSYSEGNYHFVMLDPEEIPETGYRSVRFPEEQQEWLKNDLELNSDKFMIISYHQPLGSWDSASYEKFMKIVDPYKFQMFITAGHTHDNRVVYRDGIAEYQDGAPCGDWWQTGKTPDGSPMGYAVYNVDDGKISRFYKGTNTVKQMNLLGPVDVDINATNAIKIKAYYKDKNIVSARYAIDGDLSTNPLTLDEIDASNIIWYNIDGALTLSQENIDNQDHNVTIVLKTDDGEDYNASFVYKFTNERFMKIGDILNEENFNNYYGRFVEVNATITDVQNDGNLIDITDPTGTIVVWAGDSYHPEFKVGDQLTLRGQITAFRDTKELKLVSPDDVEVYGYQEYETPSYDVESIESLYTDFDQYENTYVSVEGVLTADFGSMKIIQDETRGVAIYLNNTSEYEIGSNISVKGKLISYYGLTEIKPDNLDAISQDGTASIPNPQLVGLNEILGNLNNLVKVESVTVAEISGSSIVVVNDSEDNASIYCGKAGFDPINVKVGDVIDVVGIAGIYYNKGQIYPRSTEDITVVSTSSTTEADLVSDTNTTNIVDLYTNFDSLNGSYVGVSGVVTANFGNNIAIQDETQGIILYIASEIPELIAGNKVTVGGDLTSYKGLVEIKISDSNVSIDANETVPAPKFISVTELEQNMGTLVELKSLSVDSVSSSSITLSDSNGNTTTAYCGKAGFDPSSVVSEGDNINIVGISGYYNNPQILPRSVEDITKN